MAQPYIRFFGCDWRSDPGLRMCSLAARGLWIDLLTLMMEADPYGHLIVAGEKPTLDQVGSLIGSKTADVKATLAELVKRRVCDIRGDGVIFSRRMIRDAAKAAQDKANGKRGGNPNIVERGKPTGSKRTQPHPATPNGNGSGFIREVTQLREGTELDDPPFVDNDTGEVLQ